MSAAMYRLTYSVAANGDDPASAADVREVCLSAADLAECCVAAEALFSRALAAGSTVRYGVWRIHPDGGQTLLRSGRYGVGLDGAVRERPAPPTPPTPPVTKGIADRRELRP